MPILQEPEERYARRQLLIGQFWVWFGFAVFPFILGLIYILPSRQPIKPDGIAWPPSPDWFAPIAVPAAAVALLAAYGAWHLIPILHRLLVSALAGILILVLPGTWAGMSDYLPFNLSRFQAAMACWWAIRTLVAVGEPPAPGVNRARAIACPLGGFLLTLVPGPDEEAWFWPWLWISWLVGTVIETDGLRVRWKSFAGPGGQG